MQDRFSKRAVLIVDDDPRWLRLIERWLDDVPYRYVTTSSSSQALQEIIDNHFDVVVSDMSMPVVSGNELMRQVKLKLPSAVRIVMSGKMDLVGSIEAINKGEVYRYLVKPCDAKVFKLAIYEALELIERREKKETRQREIQKASAQKIKKMAQSIRSLEYFVDVAHEGLMAALRGIVMPTEQQKLQASMVIDVLTQLSSRVDLSHAFRKELELITGLQQVAYADSSPITLDGNGDVVRNSPLAPDSAVFDKVSEVLLELNFSVAALVLAKIVKGDPINTSITIDTDKVSDLGYAILCIAYDVVILENHYGQTVDEASLTILRNSNVYGSHLVAELF